MMGDGLIDVGQRRVENNKYVLTNYRKGGPEGARDSSMIYITGNLTGAIQDRFGKCVRGFTPTDDTFVIVSGQPLSQEEIEFIKEGYSAELGSIQHLEGTRVFREEVPVSQTEYKKLWDWKRPGC